MPATAPAQGPATALDGFHAQLHAIREDAEELLSGLSDAQLNWRPEPGRWSVAECVTHLSLTGSLYLPALDRGIAEARERGRTGGGEYRPGWLGRILVRSMEPPPRMRSRTQERIRPPAPARTLEEVREEFFRVQDELERRLRDAEGIDLSRAKVTSPLAKWLRIRLGDALGFVLAHQRRHLWQARRVREDTAFPRA